MIVLFDVIYHRRELGFGRLVDHILFVFTNHGFVGRNRHHPHLVSLLEFGGLRLGGTGHTGSRTLGIKPHIILQGNRSQGLVLGLNLYPFFGLNSLVHPLVIAPTRQHTSGVFIHNQDFTLGGNNVVLVQFEQFLGFNRIVQKPNQRGVSYLVKIVNSQVILYLVDTGLQNTNRAFLFINLVVLAAIQGQHHLREILVPVVDIALGGTRNNQGSTSLVNQNRVNLVDDDVVVTTLYQVLNPLRHIVTQIVETELVICPIGNIAVVLLAPLRRIHLSQDNTRGQTCLLYTSDAADE